MQNLQWLSTVDLRRWGDGSRKDEIRAATAEESGKEWLWVAPALAEEGRCLRSHENLGTNEAEMTLHWGPWKPPFPYPGRCFSLILLFQCPKSTKCSCKRPIASKSCMLRTTNRPCQAPIFSDQLCPRQLLCSVGSGVITGCFPRSKLIWEHAWKGKFGPL